MPQFSGVSFISKILMFLDPSTYCVLDRQLARLTGPGQKALHRLKCSGNQIGVTAHNEALYDAWREECRGISLKYFDGRYRVADVERGFFQLIQAGQLGFANELYVAA